MFGTNRPVACHNAVDASIWSMHSQHHWLFKQSIHKWLTWVCQCSMRPQSPEDRIAPGNLSPCNKQSRYNSPCTSRKEDVFDHLTALVQSWQLRCSRLQFASREAARMRCIKPVAGLKGVKKLEQRCSSQKLEYSTQSILEIQPGKLLNPRMNHHRHMCSIWCKWYNQTLHANWLRSESLKEANAELQSPAA